MARDVIITPASGLIDFQGSVGVTSATIELDASGNLNIANSGGDLTLGDTSRDVYIGNGVANVDIVFEQNGEIRGLTGKTITLGQSDSFISFGGNITGVTTFTGNIVSPTFTSTQATGTAPFTVSSTTVVTNLNADKLDGQEGSYYRNATNINAGTLDNARLPQNINVSGIVTANSIVVEDYRVSSVTGSFTASVGVSTDIDSFTISVTDFKTTEYTLHFINGTNIQSQKVLVMQNGTNAYAQEYAIMYEPNQIVSIGSTISGGICKLQATPETGISGITTYRFVRGGLL